MLLVVKKSIETCRTSLATRLFTSRRGKNKRSSGDSWQGINIRLRRKQFRRSGFRRLAQTLWSTSPFLAGFFCELAAAPLCCFLQMISKRRPRVKRFILKSHSLTAEKSPATLLCNTPCISSAAWITRTAAANQISSECRLTLPRSLPHRVFLRRRPYIPSAALHYSLSSPEEPPPHAAAGRNVSHEHACMPTRGPEQTADQKDINVNNPWRDE